MRPTLVVVPTRASFLYLALVIDVFSRTGIGWAMDARRAVFDSLEGCYDPLRRHSALGYPSPEESEATHAAAAPDAEPGGSAPRPPQTMDAVIG